MSSVLQSVGFTTFAGAAVALAVVGFVGRRPLGRALGTAGRWTRLQASFIGVVARLVAEGLRRVADAASRRGDLFWILVLTAIGALIYFPYLSIYPLWDPWEPHYTQVAWEMQDHNTWLNPWYRGIDNWWSKPIGMLAMLRLSLAIGWDSVEHFGDHELAARIPFALFAILGGLLQYHWAARLYGRRVGVLAALALITAPQYLLIGRQVMVDVPFVATYAASMGYLAVGLFTPRPPLAAHDAGEAQRVLAWWKREWPFVAFWTLQAVSMLFKGFVPPTMAVMVIAAYWIVTFRWRDYEAEIAALPVGSYLARRTGIALVLAGLAGAAVWALGLPPMRGVTGGLSVVPALGWQVTTAVAVHAWIAVALVRGARERRWRLRYGGPALGTAVATLALYAIQTTLAEPSVPLVLVRIALTIAGVTLVTRGTVAGTAPGAGQTHRVVWGVLVALLFLSIFTGIGAEFAPLTTRPAGSRELILYQAIIAACAAAAIGLWLYRELPPVRHALHILKRMRASWGLWLFFFVGAPWFIYMTFEHGWPYWNEWLYYHHLGRAAGTIDKPGNTFDYYVRQLGFAFFPWSAFFAAAAWGFLDRCRPRQSVAGRRNTWFLLALVVPYLFFTLSGTKFAHYIFPVVPFCCLVVAAGLAWLGREPPARPPLSEEEPRIGAPVPAYGPRSFAVWRRPNQSAALILFTTLSLIGFSIFAHDLVLDFRWLLRLFIYYYNRTTPESYYPFVELQLFFIPMGILIATLLVGRWISRWHLVVFSAGAVAFACYLGWVTLPAMEDNFSYKPFYYAYEKLKKPGDEIGEYNDWQQPERSVIFLFKNRCQHLRNDRITEAFLKRPGRKFIIVHRDKLPALRRVARDAQKALYVVFDGHPYARMVSDVPNAEDARRVASHILKEPPAGMEPIAGGGASFEGMITLLGSTVEPPEVRPGQTAKVSFYYRCEKLIDNDWQIFVHGDSSRGGSQRIHADHFPLEGLYPTTEWQVGEIIRDTFEVTVPANYAYNGILLWTGWYRGESRMRLVNDAPNDGDNRVRGPELKVILDGAP